MFRWLREQFEWLAELATGRTKRPPVVFQEVAVMETPPPIAAVKANTLYVVKAQSTSKWAMFLCPCGCSDVITLSLQPIHNPRWNLEVGRSGRASLYPSVWRTTGCRSHFWLKDGRVFWA